MSPFAAITAGSIGYVLLVWLHTVRNKDENKHYTGLHACVAIPCGDMSDLHSFQGHDLLRYHGSPTSAQFAILITAPREQLTFLFTGNRYTFMKEMGGHQTVARNTVMRTAREAQKVFGCQVFDIGRHNTHAVVAQTQLS